MIVCKTYSVFGTLNKIFLIFYQNIITIALKYIDEKFSKFILTVNIDIFVLNIIVIYTQNKNHYYITDCKYMFCRKRMKLEK